MNSVSRYTPIPHLQQALYRHQSDLFQRYSKILMIRTDFHWREKTDRYRYGDIHQLATDMTLLMLRLSEVSGIIGHAWVIEDGLDRGLHAHAVIYVNGQQHRKKWAFCERMNQLWKIITEGEGYLYHCPDKQDYQASIRFPVDYRHEAGRADMRYVVNYLAKSEQKGDKPVYTLSTLSSYKPTGRSRHRKRRSSRSKQTE
ncbi:MULTISPECIES: inovirus-type Gp2 protein [Providencia]|uniref:inovirus-type Gp2 protein n=1 Tax=Providencia TaxID=586 RepID=UPI0024803622|nr:inovirus-type Gp2 protein [Providencia rettgeri]EMA4784681.1 inovirus-type Gp2 protein [Providencia rettgeri]EMB3080287.1 inovirus-type Gp2 protein [Providencia rettgeri]MDU7492659.1 inovirus-type Gp2 protein [Providencia rettgeri]HEM8138205.1 inovirus-type Gp2 protein [Providencia rettgeri]HEM8308036.1 inovirus-type Gp2 protein [Providencia rettgeri]